MPCRKSIPTLFLFLVLPALGWAVNKDPAAVAALSQMITSTGWNPANLPADTVVSGTVTLGSGASSAATLKMKGLSQYRADVQNDSSTTSIIVNNGQAAKILADGTTQSLGLQDSISNWAVAVPVFSNLPLAASAQNISALSLGTESVNGVSCNKVKITADIRGDDPINKILASAASITVWLDAATGLPIQMQYTRIASDNPSSTAARIRQFSNYQLVSGVQVAFTQQEFAENRLLYTVQLSAVTFNVGLPDSDFAIPQQ
jgi:outer membrane lipoprotein-sorting protein